MTQEIIIEPEKLDCDAIAKQVSSQSQGFMYFTDTVQLTSYSVTCTPRDVEKQLTKLIKSGEITRFGVITHAEDTEEDAAPAMKSVRREPADAAPNPSLKRSANGKEKGDGTEAVTISKSA